jgi:Asp-tRNA(Asn)/Glu-tRNA(Gln) amidotransferase A subunit family amidase
MNDHPDPATPRPLTLDAIAAAEAIAGVAYTDAERALMLDGLKGQIELTLRRRQTTLPWDLGPAQRFDPRLPGFTMPETGPFRWEPENAPLPGDDEGIAFASLARLAGWMRAGRITAARLTRLYLDRIERLNPRLLCYAVVLPEAALAQASAMDALLAGGTWLGPLHGIPYGMKDILDTAGVETSWGAEPYRGRIPEEDAFVTARLREAGAVLLGKTTVGALAYGDLWHGGRTRNPWNVAEGSSGSSAGSASAVVAGLAGFAIGTETLGSIVSPSARCGTAGLRPTFGRVSRRGAMPLCWSLDKIGPITRYADDTAPVLAAINAPDALDAFQIPATFGYDPGLPLACRRLGYYAADFADEDGAALEAARRIGLVPVELQRRELPYDALVGVLFAEAAASFEDLTLTDRDDELAWQDADAWPNQFRSARFLTAVDHVQLDRLRRLVMQEMDAALREADFILAPSLTDTMTVITNLTGHPCLTVRAGFRDLPTRGRESLLPVLPTAAPAGPPARVPWAVSLYGRLFEEGALVAAGRALEEALGAAAERPAL